MMPNPPLGIDEVQGRPVSVAEGIPDRVVVVDHDRIVDPQVLGGSADVVEVVLDVELRGVDAEHDQPLVLVVLGPGAEVGKGAEPVDAGVGPEVDQEDPAAQVRRRERRRVEPAAGAGERRQVTLDRQVDRGSGRVHC
jgi:hypothetical protein